MFYSTFKEIVTVANGFFRVPRVRRVGGACCGWVVASGGRGFGVFIYFFSVPPFPGATRAAVFSHSTVTM